jgi:hypothetical protein
VLDPLVGKRLDDHFSAGHFACHVIPFRHSRPGHNKKGP